MQAPCPVYQKVIRLGDWLRSKRADYKSPERKAAMLIYAAAAIHHESDWPDPPQWPDGLAG
ncbi:hypothetical protein O3G_MSEX005163 [Manduca sexta]|uniref:Uncharacterized protein n=1 Tax=Manduca sexta TaxID=7130 RepID=A0A922CI87_MANSE|nr:hypothetical protein O3G_MSEX005163 [Manduca sexta]